MQQGKKRNLQGKKLNLQECEIVSKMISMVDIVIKRRFSDEEDVVAMGVGVRE